MTTRDKIRAQYHAVLADWTRNCTVQRFVSTTDASGRKVGTYQTLSSTEPIWIQAVSRGDETVQEKGITAQTTHLAFQYWDGLALEPQDRITDIDEQGYSHEYDVIRAHLKESHRVAELALVQRVGA